MTRCEYERLEPEDVIQEGDELRFATPLSSLTQHVDESLDRSRSRWQQVSPCWVGRRASEFFAGCKRFGRVDIRRKLVA